MNILAGILLLAAVSLGFISMANEEFLPFSIGGKLLLCTIAIVISFVIGETALAVVAIIAVVLGTIGNLLGANDGGLWAALLAIAGMLANVVVAILLFI